ncbi:MAG TPA: hypothetical protein PLQ09_09365 [Prolixibacteraceae bacterium]|nr:DUF4348 domain-containing protein [Bacteroidales bacterium]HQN94319.1 hypothetical protein [Prolixibacteraceae bacterium]
MRVYLIIAVVGLFLSCSGEKKKAAEPVEVIQAQVESDEPVNVEDAGIIDASDVELEDAQSEIDSLLNDI